MKKLNVLLVSGILASSAFAADLTFTIGEWPPYTGETEVDYGLSSKQVSDICAKAGLKCEMEFMPWKRAITMTKKARSEGTFPWVCGAETRKGQFMESKPLFQGETVIFYTGDLPEGAESDITKLSSKNPVGINSYTDAETLKSKGVKIHMVNEAKLAWKMMAKGRADSFIDDKEVGLAECRIHAPEVCDKIKISKPVRSSNMCVLFTRVGDDNQNEKMKKFMDAM